MFQKLLYCLSFLSVLCCSSCEREVEVPTDYKYAYFPLETGKYRIYELDSIIYDDFNMVVDTNRWELKVEIGDLELDNLGREYHRVNRYLRKNSASPWQFQEVWGALIENGRAESIEGNQRYIPLVFPPTPEKYWDGNVFADLDTTFAIGGASIDVYKDWEDFNIQEVDVQATVNSLSFDSTLFVVQVNSENNIELRYSIERYAKNVGLIQKEMKILDTQCGGNLIDCIGVPWEEKADNGFILRLNLLEYN